jgi:hypothetical protein
MAAITRSHLTTCLVLLAAAAPAWTAPPSFEREVGPLLRERCLKCHSGGRPRGDLDLTSQAGLRAGGDSGPVVQPGKAADSLLFQHVRDGKMPPKQPLSAAEVELLRRWIDAGVTWDGPNLSPPGKAEVRRAGADWWSLQPVRRPPLPRVARSDWCRTPIDAFVLARLEASGLAPAPEADRRTLLRRLTLDLTGLLPTPEEIDAFAADRAAGAYERVVDRLLASPAYGERWGRHWLDVVRFAESHGYEQNTLRPSAWPYRDYVIRAFNRDVPYPQFVREQLAGDAAGGDLLSEAATGFLVGGPHDLVVNATVEGKRQQRMDDLFDMVSTTGTTFLGLTVGCARCHDHKFDPITQRDFYGLQAVFAGVEHGERPSGVADASRRREAAALRDELTRLERECDRHGPPAAGPGATAKRPPVSPERNVERFAPLTARFVRFTVTATTDGTEPCVDELEVYGPGGLSNLALASAGARPSASSVYEGSPLHKVEHVNDGRLGNGRSWISRERGAGWVQVELPKACVIDRVVWGRDRERKYRDRLAREYRVEVSADGTHWKAVAGSWDRLAPGEDGPPPPAALARLLARRKDLGARVAELEQPQMVYCGQFREPEPTYVLKRGDPMQKLDEVGPAGVAAVRPAFALKANATERERRLALADWVASADNPLTARVLVNRVWHWHFGQGLVRTPSDFGSNGDRPSHPELLDWLAHDFMDGGWRLKRLHRLIVLSAAYRQSSEANPKAQAVDAGNRLLWRHTPRRLEAEAIRDTMLQVSGALDRRMGGPGYHLWDYSGYVIVFKPKADPGPEALRRMVYQFKPRLQQDGTFGAFDCPDATATAPRRNVSTTALQALNLLNDPFVHGQAQRFAGRLHCEAGDDPAAQVHRAFRLAFEREPSATEAEASLRLVREHGLAVLCRVLFNANEFVFAN